MSGAFGLEEYMARTKSMLAWQKAEVSTLEGFMLSVKLLGQFHFYMATIICGRSNHFRLLSRFLVFQRTSLHLARPFISDGDPLSYKNLPFLQSNFQVIPDVSGIQSLMICTRRNYGTTAPNNSEKVSEGASGANSGSSEKYEGDRSRNTRNPIRGGPVSWLSFLLLVATGAGLISYYDKEKKRHIEEIHKKSEAVKQGPSAGKAAIGGPFKLVNHNGKHVTNKDFVGAWTLIYFGFTHCPDICPDELQKLAAAIDKIKQKSGIDVVPVFISVDPERDTVEQVREYVAEFHPKLIGLTGSSEEIQNVARSYRVYYMKTAEEDSDYLVDHSIVMYLMSPLMEFVKFFGKNNDVDSLADGVIKEIKQHK